MSSMEGYGSSAYIYLKVTFFNFFCNTKHMSTNMKFLLKDFKNYLPEFCTCCISASSMARKVAKKRVYIFWLQKLEKDNIARITGWKSWNFIVVLCIFGRASNSGLPPPRPSTYEVPLP